MDRRLKDLIRAWYNTPTEELQKQVAVGLIRAQMVPEGVARFIDSLGSQDKQQRLSLMLAAIEDDLPPDEEDIFEQQILEGDNIRFKFIRSIMEEANTDAFFRQFTKNIYASLLRSILDKPGLLQELIDRKTTLINLGADLPEYGGHGFDPTSYSEPPSLGEVTKVMKEAVNSIFNPQLITGLEEITTFFHPIPFPESFEEEPALHNYGISHPMPRPETYPSSDELFCYQNGVFNFLVGLAHFHTGSPEHKPLLYRTTGASSFYSDFTILVPDLPDEDGWVPEFPGVERLKGNLPLSTRCINMIPISALSLLFLNEDHCIKKAEQLKKSTELEGLGFTAHDDYQSILQEQTEYPQVQAQIEVIDNKIALALLNIEAFDEALAKGAPGQKILDSLFRSCGFPSSPDRKSHKASLEAANNKLHSLREELASTELDADQISEEADKNKDESEEQFKTGVPDLFKTLYPFFLDVAEITILQMYSEGY